MPLGPRGSGDAPATVPLDPDEHFDIPDLTEEEWQTFVAALEQ